MLTRNSRYRETLSEARTISLLSVTVWPSVSGGDQRDAAPVAPGGHPLAVTLDWMGTSNFGCSTTAICNQQWGQGWMGRPGGGDGWSYYPPGWGGVMVGGCPRPRTYGYPGSQTQSRPVSPITLIKTPIIPSSSKAWCVQNRKMQKIYTNKYKKININSGAISGPASLSVQWWRFAGSLQCPSPCQAVTTSHERSRSIMSSQLSGA